MVEVGGLRRPALVLGLAQMLELHRRSVDGDEARAPGGYRLAFACDLFGRSNTFETATGAFDYACRQHLLFEAEVSVFLDGLEIDLGQLIHRAQFEAEAAAGEPPGLCWSA